MKIWLSILFLSTLLLDASIAMAANGRRNSYYEEEGQKRRSYYEEEFSEGRESSAQSNEPINDPDYVLPFYAAFDLGLTNGSAPGSSSNLGNIDSVCYNFSIGLDTPIFLWSESTLLAGAYVNMRYPTYVNLKRGEPVFHLSGGPVLRLPFSLDLGEAIYVDVAPSFAYNFTRHDYASATITTNGPQLGVETKAKFMSLQFWSSTPMFVGSFSYFGIGTSYAMKTNLSQSERDVFLGPTLGFNSSGEASGYSWSALGGFAFRLGDSPADHEILFGMSSEYSRLAGLKLPDFGDDRGPSDGEYANVTYLLSWRRAWASE